jgi:hypothetical protein
MAGHDWIQKVLKLGTYAIKPFWKREKTYLKPILRLLPIVTHKLFIGLAQTFKGSRGQGKSKKVRHVENV